MIDLHDLKRRLRIEGKLAVNVRLDLRIPFDYGKQPLPRSVVEDVAWELGVSPLRQPSVLTAKSLRHVLQIGSSIGSTRRL